tara:strand:+ start:2193 stop:2312 length:120 start_codon:yes stop_codon:yes gene_type:complete
MIKKTILIIFISLLFVSCGKKNCPKIDQENKCKEVFKKS